MSSPAYPADDNSPAAVLQRALHRHWPPAHWRDVTVLIAVSGGADSVALLRAAAAERDAEPAVVEGQIVAAHFHHGLRPEADDDEQFVVELCQGLGIPCRVGRAEVAALAADQGDGFEAAAREARYAWLLELAHEIGARYVATAHTADDQIETILHRILRGTGLRGLAGMTAVRSLAEGVSLVRPLLAVSRAQVEAYLESLGQTWRDDATNQDPQYTRNRIRHELLPLLASEYNPRIGEALTRLGELAGEAQLVIEELVDNLYERGVREAENSVRLNRDVLGGEPNYVIRELLKRIWRERAWTEQAMSYTHWHTLAELASGTSPQMALDLPGGIAARREGSEVVLSAG